MVGGFNVVGVDFGRYDYSMMWYCISEGLFLLYIFMYVLCYFWVYLK